MDFSVKESSVTVVGAHGADWPPGFCAVAWARVTLADMASSCRKLSARECRRRCGPGVRVELGPPGSISSPPVRTWVVSPGVPFDQPALEEARKAACRSSANWNWPLAGSRRRLPHRDQGKSTTTTLASRC